MGKKTKKEKEELPFDVRTDSETLSNSVRAMMSVLSSATLVFDKDGLRVKEANSGSSACVNFFMKSDKFDKYQVPQTTELRVDLAAFKSYYDRCRSGYSEKARFQTNGESLIISQIGRTGRQTKEFTLPLIASGGYDSKSEVNVDEVEKALTDKTDIEMPIDKKEFRSALKDLELVISTSGFYGSNSNCVNLLARKDFLVIQDAENNRAKSIIERYHAQPTKDLAILAQKDYKIKSQFGFEQLVKLFSLGRTEFTDKFTFRMGDNNPLQILFENTDKDTSLKITLANRVGV